MHISAALGLAKIVHVVHILSMERLQEWMEKRGKTDAALAALVDGKPSRSQISRIRRGISGTSKAAAHKLEKVTGIPWHEFIGGEQ